MSGDEPFDIGFCRVVRSSELSMTVEVLATECDELDEEDCEVTIPISQILSVGGEDLDEDSDIDDEGHLYCTEWLAEQRGWM